jgi:hypothetical protein
MVRLAAVLSVAGMAVAISAAAFPTLVVDPPPPVLNPPLVGFSFSPYSLTDGRDPAQALGELLDQLQPDIVRLPVYWESVAPDAQSLDFSPIDQLIRTVQDHNAKKGARQTQLVLVVGARNLVYPEVHLPPWLDTRDARSLEPLLQTSSYRHYLTSSFQRYAHLSILRAWQVENEPLDNVSTGAIKNAALPGSTLESEVDLLRSIDLVHDVVITTYNSSHPLLDVEGASPIAWLYQHLPGAKPVGHPSQALTLGDTLGLDLYVVTEDTPLKVISASTRIAWKEQALDFWQTQAEKTGHALWITEMQGSPWSGTTGFTPNDLVSSALAYRGHGVSAYLLWGVEAWLDSPTWMKTGLFAIKLLRQS